LSGTEGSFANIRDDSRPRKRSHVHSLGWTFAGHSPDIRWTGVSIKNTGRSNKSSTFCQPLLVQLDRE
jgi:hypothetical protein